MDSAPSLCAKPRNPPRRLGSDHAPVEGETKPEPFMSFCKLLFCKLLQSVPLRVEVKRRLYTAVARW